MAIIPGTESADDLVGTAAADTIEALDGNDTIDGKAGADTILAGAGDDTIVETTAPQPGSTYNGGAGLDTLVLKPLATAAPSPYGPLTSYSFASPAPPTPPITMTGLEQLEFDSLPSSSIQVTFLLPGLAASGITGLTGGGGRDALAIFALTPVATMPALTFRDWDTTGAFYRAELDLVSLVAVLPGNSTLNARDNYGSAQFLGGGAGNDTLNGSNGVDFLAGGGGVNKHYGNDGDDLLGILNNTVNGVTSTLTGAGSLFDGGNGIDTFGVNGVVNFQGTLVSIERIFLNKPFTSPVPALPSNGPAHLTLTGSTLAGLPDDLLIEGQGTLTINMVANVAYDASGFEFFPDSAIATYVNGTGSDDRVVVGGAAETVDGGVGKDTAVFAGNLANHTVSAGPDGSVTVGDDSFVNVEQFRFADDQYRWDGSQMVSLTRTLSDDADSAVGAELDDAILGLAGNDTISGQSGDDRLDGGDGKDRLHGDQGDDSLLGGGDNDYLYGGQGDDTLDCGDGDDMAVGDQGDDLLLGGSGGDWLYGMLGDDVLFGGGDNDYLSGGNGDDTLIGGDGVDVLSGGAGDDELSGGIGADVFDFGLLDTSVDTIVDFEVGVDKIHLSGGVVVTGTGAAGSATTLSLSNGGSIVLAGIAGIPVLNDLLIGELPFPLLFRVGVEFG